MKRVKIMVLLLLVSQFLSNIDQSLKNLLKIINTLVYRTP